MVFTKQSHKGFDSAGLCDELLRLRIPCTETVERACRLCLCILSALGQEGNEGCDGAFIKNHVAVALGMSAHICEHRRRMSLSASRV